MLALEIQISGLNFSRSGSMHVRAVLLSPAVALMLLGGTQGLMGQQAATPAQSSETTAPAAAAQTPEAAATPQASSAPEAAAPAAGSTPAQAGTAPVSVTVPATAKGKGSSGFMGMGKKAPPYTGPTEIVVLAPTPMLDGEGRQQLDPDGKPMFNPPAKQQRDKYGHPVFDEKKQPVFQTAKDLGYDEQGKKIHAEKEKQPKKVPVSISRGTFSVDGIVGKAALNYDIADLKYIYLYVPGMGVVVVSNATFPGAKEQKSAFSDKTLTIAVGDHKLELASDNRLLGNKPESAFVRIDRDFALPSRFPVVGYGPLRAAPYAWPGAKPNKELAGVVAPPPVPVNMRPVLALQPCPAGQMRTVARVLPGQVAPPQPCVPITKNGAAAEPRAMAPGAAISTPSTSN